MGGGVWSLVSLKEFSENQYSEKGLEEKKVLKAVCISFHWIR